MLQTVAEGDSCLLMRLNHPFGSALFVSSSEQEK